jgi:CRP-like cAMP-binding protein
MDLNNTKSAKEVLKELKALKTTNGLTTQSLEMLASIGVKRVYKMNDCIWRTGDAGEFIAVVLEGLVEIRRFSGRDEESCLGIFGPADAIGLSALMNKRPYPGNAMVLAAGTTVLKLYLRPILHSKAPEEL